MLYFSLRVRMTARESLMDTQTVLLIGGATLALMLLTVLLLQRRKRRDERDWLDWMNIQRFHRVMPESAIFQVTRIRQRARTGTKGFACRLDAEQSTAFWISDVWPKKGEILVCQGE